MSAGSLIDGIICLNPQRANGNMNCMDQQIKIGWELVQNHLIGINEFKSVIVFL